MPRGSFASSGVGANSGSGSAGKLIQGTEEQEAIWNVLLNTEVR